MRHLSLGALLLCACSFNAREGTGAGTDDTGTTGTTGSSLGHSSSPSAVTTAPGSSASTSSGSDSATASEAVTSSDDEDTSSTTSGSGSTDTGATCAPIQVDVDAFVDEGETRVVEFDFDQLPLELGELVELCVDFSTSNPASARSISIDGQVMTYGPCGGDKGLHCEEFFNPTGTVDVVLDNTTPSGGCQTGDMSDVVLFFGCAEAGSSSTG
ncbi:MAG: hypothetical protein K0U11_06760 [Gammaproteobacteria bacterium]|nr:hypothetical protein [Gammaproteobacteria bacterium]